MNANTSKMLDKKLPAFLAELHDLKNDNCASEAYLAIAEFCGQFYRNYDNYTGLFSSFKAMHDRQGHITPEQANIRYFALRAMLREIEADFDYATATQISAAI